jgi:hypothetical protein
MNSDINAEAFQTLDALSTGYILQSPRRILKQFWQGLTFNSNYAPAGDISEGGTLTLIIRAIDLFTWIMLLAGLLYHNTRLYSMMGLGLWIIPSLGNIVSLYDVRYYTVTAGIPLVIAIIICRQFLFVEEIAPPHVSMATPSAAKPVHANEKMVLHGVCDEPISMSILCLSG